jgi:uncharacterized membrane protein YidH (DUF202 family)
VTRPGDDAEPNDGVEDVEAVADRGVAVERTALAWNRTGLASAASGGITVKVFWGNSGVGMAVAALLLAIGAFAYFEGASGYRLHLETGLAGSARRLRLLSLSVGAAAALSVVVAVQGS